MKQFTIKSALFICAMMLVFSACGNKEKYTLVYNLNAGDVFGVFMSVDMNISQSVMGQSMDIGNHMKMNSLYVVNSVDENTIDMDFMFTSMRMDMSAAGFELSFDSETDTEFATAEDMSPLFRAITNLPFNMVMDRQGNVKSVSGMEKMIDAMFSVFDDEIDDFTKEQMVAQLGQQFDSESMQTTMGQSFAIFPENPVRIGESWKTTGTVNAGQVNLNMDMKTTLKSVNSHIAVLHVHGEFSTDAPIVQVTNGMETSVTLTGTQHGTMEIDMNTGWIIKGELTQDMKTEVEVQGMKLPQTISSKITILTE
jgi:hypothetical protein